MFLPDMEFLVLNYGFIIVYNRLNIIMSKTFEPLKLKYKKYFRAKTLRRVHNTLEYSRLKFSSLGLKILTFGFISSIQLFSVKQSIFKKIKKIGKCIFNCFPNSVKSKKKEAGRMGKGKGDFKIYVFRLKPGFILCELKVSIQQVGIDALKSAQYRLPIKTAIIYN
jgi:large subunit ribosomal protein L16